MPTTHHPTRQWQSHTQRPDAPSLYTPSTRNGEQARVLPISNWTELEVCQRIAEEDLEVPSICFAHGREVFSRDETLPAVSPFAELGDGGRRGCVR
jgi:sulfate adenylyltransferase subunit 2